MSSMKVEPSFFEKYLSIWVILCILAGIGLGYVARDSISVLSAWNIATVSNPLSRFWFCSPFLFKNGRQNSFYHRYIMCRAIG